MNLEQDIKHLQGMKAFANFLAEIHNSREQWLSALSGATEKEALRISARIAQLDQILIDCDAQETFRKHEMAPAMHKPTWFRSVKLWLALRLSR